MDDSRIDKELVEDVAAHEDIDSNILTQLLELAYSVSDITMFGARTQMTRDVLKIISDADNEE